MRWGIKKAKAYWNFVPPARPSSSELCICTSHLRKIQKRLNRKVDLLVLGSTTEFRDWGFEQYLNVSVIDYSRVYHNEVNKTRRHGNRNEKLIYQRWQDMKFFNHFDIIAGDSVIFNLNKADTDIVLKNIYQALRKRGIFITKSVFKGDKKVGDIESIFKNYYEKYSHYNPVTSVLYDLNMCYRDNKNETVNYCQIFEHIKSLYASRKINKDTFNVFKQYRWYEFDFNLYIPTFESWENSIIKYFKQYKKLYSDDLYSKDMPLYILQK